MRLPTSDRRHSHRFAELVDEAGRRWRHRRRADLDDELSGLVRTASRLGDAAVVANPDEEFRAGLRAMLMATIERDGIGVSAEDHARQAAARAAVAGKTVVLPKVPVGNTGRTRAAVLTGVVAGALALSGVSAASTDALPGDPLYRVKRSSERAQLALAGSDLSRGQLYLEFARARYAEARRVDPADVERLLAAMDVETRRGVSLLTTVAVAENTRGPLDIVLGFVRQHRGRLAELTADRNIAAESVHRSVQLLDAVEERALALSAALGEGCTAGAMDELGPRPGGC